MKYLVFVKTIEGSELLEFPTKEHRKIFLKSIKSCFGGFVEDIATSEIGDYEVQEY